MNPTPPSGGRVHLADEDLGRDHANEGMDEPIFKEGGWR